MNNETIKDSSNVVTEDSETLKQDNEPVIDSESEDNENVTEDVQTVEEPEDVDSLEGKEDPQQIILDYESKVNELTDQLNLEKEWKILPYPN